MFIRRIGFLALAALALGGPFARAADVRVAVAANFTVPLQKIAEEFEKESGHKVLASFGSTGKFYAQIRNGAPFEILLAADDETPMKLAAEGAASPASRFTYAIGKLVLWSTDPARVDPDGAVLKRGRFNRLAVANPKLAPYGAAALEVMTRLGVLEALGPKLVQGESIGQTHQFVATGNADLGFVALAQVLTAGRIEGSAWIVPAALHEPIRQDAILLNPGKGQAAAEAFLAYLKSPKASAIIRSFGYELN